MNTKISTKRIDQFYATFDLHQKQLKRILRKHQITADGDRRLYTDKPTGIRFLSLIFLFLMAGNSVSYGQDFKWVNKMTSTKTDQGAGAAVDIDGNVYTTGYFNDVAHFNGDSLTSYGGNDIYLAKYTTNGDLIWVKGMGGTGSDAGTAVATDSLGNVFITGSIGAGGDVFFNGSDTNAIVTSFGVSDVFLAKYDKDGQFLWVKNMGGDKADQANALVVDGEGNVTITGGFKSQPADFNPGGTGGAISNQGSNKNSDVFLAKYDKDGQFLWVKAMGGTGNNNGYGVAVNSSDDIYVAGAYNGSARFDTASTASVNTAGVYDIFLAKYDKDGHYEWVKSMGGAKNDHAIGVTTDNKDNVAIIGYFDSPTLFFNPGGSGPDSLDNIGGSIDIYLAKFDAAGNFLWANAMGGSKQDHGQALVADRIGNLFITGTFESPNVDFNFGSTGDTVSNAGAYNIFLAKYDPNGGYLWSKSMGGSSNDWGKGIATDFSGNVFVSGYFSSPTADFNKDGSQNGTITSDGKSYDGFLAKYGCSDTTVTSFTKVTCERSYVLNDSVYTTDGIYTQRMVNLSGCDSVITLDLTFFRIKPIINVDGFTLGTTVDTFTSYQWLLNGNTISGATSDKYTVSQNGDYQVVVTNNEGCTDTSDIYTVNNYDGSGIEHTTVLAKMIKVYPNPAMDKITILSPVKVNITLTDVTGRAVKQLADAQQVSLSSLAAGIYLLRITDQAGTLIKVEKVVKQEQ